MCEFNMTADTININRPSLNLWIVLQCTNVLYLSGCEKRDDTFDWNYLYCLINVLV